MAAILAGGATPLPFVSGAAGGGLEHRRHTDSAFEAADAINVISRSWSLAIGHRCRRSRREGFSRRRRIAERRARILTFRLAVEVKNHSALNDNRGDQHVDEKVRSPQLRSFHRVNSPHKLSQRGRGHAVMGGDLSYDRFSAGLTFLPLGLASACPGRHRRREVAHAVGQLAEIVSGRQIGHVGDIPR